MFKETEGMPLEELASEKDLERYKIIEKHFSQEQARVLWPVITPEIATPQETSEAKERSKMLEDYIKEGKELAVERGATIELTGDINKRGEVILEGVLQEEAIKEWFKATGSEFKDAEIYLGETALSGRGGFYKDVQTGKKRVGTIQEKGYPAIAITGKDREVALQISKYGVEIVPIEMLNEKQGYKKLVIKKEN